MQLFLEASENCTFLLEMIISYLKLEERGKIKIIYLSPGAIKAQKNNLLKIELPSLITQEGQVVKETFKICNKLFEILPQWRSFFLGECAAEQAEIKGIKSNLKEGKQLRKHLQKHLQNRTFFVSNHLTFADFFMFTQLYDNVIEMTDEQKNQYNNLFRWYKHIQNMQGIKDFLDTKKRFVVVDPIAKVAFLAEKKKPKKQKTKEQKPKNEVKVEKKKEQ